MPKLWKQVKPCYEGKKEEDVINFEADLFEAMQSDDFDLVWEMTEPCHLTLPSTEKIEFRYDMKEHAERFTEMFHVDEYTTEEDWGEDYDSYD